MEPNTLREIMDASGFTSNVAAAKQLGVHRMTIARWLSGDVVINAFAAALIRERLREGAEPVTPRPKKPRKKKR
jgi:hypothetical protein